MILSGIYPHLMLDKKKKINILKKFIYYRISLAISELLQNGKVIKNYRLRTSGLKKCS